MGRVEPMKKFLCCYLALLLPAVAMPAETVTIPYSEIEMGESRTEILLEIEF